jgi:hypothetical protein
MGELKDNYFLVRTRGFIAEIEQKKPDIATTILQTTLREITPERDFIVFDPKAKERRTEDEGRSLRVPSKADVNVYAKLDDYGSKEALSESVGYSVNTQYVITLMLAEEY